MSITIDAGDESGSNEGNGSSTQEMLSGVDLLKGVGVINGMFGGTMNVLTQVISYDRCTAVDLHNLIICSTMTSH